ncbi:hypothetical protein ID866_4946 [Astraeus odoratus]|nr:hypothetical protein ID866_4946 [Astraeus odoratus]
MSGVEFTVYKGSSSGKIVESKVHKDLKPDEVLIRITHAGLCGTDLHYKHQDMVLSHEGIGIVEQIGSNVGSFKVGDRAGWGYLHDACLRCDQCLSGNEIYCSKRALYGGADFDQGACATHAVWKEAFLFHIPAAISSPDAAPLMCAGATVFNALENFDVRPTDRVGVVGIGGLGHLAIQFAAKMGCDVVAFSGTDSKKAMALSLGAKEFYATKGVEKLDIGRPVDHLVVTASMTPDWNLYLPIIARRATIYPLTVSSGDFSIPHLSLIDKGIRIQGTGCSSRGVHIKMLEFTALHGIKPIVQEFPLTSEGIEEAIGKLVKGQIRYRAVLVAPQI